MAPRDVKASTLRGKARRTGRSVLKTGKNSAVKNSFEKIQMLRDTSWWYICSYFLSQNDVHNACRCKKLLKYFVKKIERNRI